MRVEETVVQLFFRRVAISLPAALAMALAAGPVAAQPLTAGSAADTNPAIDPVTVVAKEFRFVPNVIRAKAGEPLTIVLKDEGVMSHNLTIFATASGKPVLAHTPTIQSRSQATLRFTPEKAGIYPFWCTVPGHKEAGMVGRVIVR